MDRLALIVLLWFAVVVPGLFLRGYWDPDEGRYGEVAREMTAGSLLVPHLAGEVYPEKPPLYFWTVAAFQAMAGSAEAPISRLPSALAALGTALLLLSLVGESHGEEAGTIAAAVSLTAFLPLQMAGWVGIDAFVTLLVVAAIRVGGGSTLRRAAVAALLAGIVLAKGAPVVIALVALAARALLDRGPRGLARRHLLWTVPLFLLLLAAWAVPAAREAGWDYIRGMTVGQAERRLVDSESHAAPPWYYLTRFPVLFLPWTVLLPAAAVVAWRDLRGGGERRAATGFYVLWFVVPFVLFSLISGKRERYILPLFPAAAALVGIAAARIRAGAGFRGLVRVPMVVALVLLAVAGVAVAALPFVFEGQVLSRLSGIEPRQQVELAAAIQRGRLVLVAGGLSALLAALDGILRRRGEAPVGPACFACACLFLAVGTALLGAMDRVKSYEPLVHEARAALPAGEARWGLVGLQPGPFCLALGTDEVEVVEGQGKRRRAIEALKGEPRSAWFADAPVYENLRDAFGGKLAVLARRTVGSREIVAFRREGGSWGD